MGVVKLSTAGILDYQKYSSFLAGNAAYSPGSYDLIQSEILTGSQASVTFDVTGLGSTYQHLQLRMTLKDGGSATSSSNTRVGLRFNADTAGNYATHTLFGRGSSVASAAVAPTGAMWISTDSIGTSATANSFLGAVVDVLDPFETTKYTTMRSLAGLTAAYYYIGLNSGVWMNTAALTSLTILPIDTSNFTQYSRFSLYGLKVA